MRFINLYSIILSLALLLPVLVSAQSQNTMKLVDYKWKNRILLVFAPAQDNASFGKQMQLINENTQGLDDRDLVVLELVPNGKHEAQRKELLKQFDVQAGAYTLILLGKDGQEKYRRQQPVGMNEIFGIIDQMPMRQQEMRKQD
jgi:hypothetical protein